MKLYWKHPKSRDGLVLSQQWRALSAITMFAVGAAGKSLYVNKDISTSTIAAYDIDPAGCLTYQSKSILDRGYGGVGLAIDTKSEALFVTFEESNQVDVVNARTLGKESQVDAPGAKNLAGIVVDEAKSRVYTVDRGTGSLYVYDWNNTNETLTLADGASEAILLKYAKDAYGLALDQTKGLLYLADNNPSKVRVYNTTDWSHHANYTISQRPMGIAVDTIRGYLYSGNAETGGKLVQTDLSGVNPEKTLDLQDMEGGSSKTGNVVGVAVDQMTGFVYTTTGHISATKSPKLLVFNSTLADTPICTPISIDDGDPTGISISGEDFSYNPLDLSVDDDISDCVRSSGGAINYNICYANLNTGAEVEDVTVIDALPDEVNFVSVSTPDSESWTYDESTRSVTWDIGDLPDNLAQVCLDLSVTVETAAAPEKSILNSVTIAGTFPNNAVVQTTQNEQTNVCPNNPPVAVCRDVLIDYESTKNGVDVAKSVDGGCYDPDGESDIQSTVLTPDGPYVMGATTQVSLKITDLAGETGTCRASVTIVGDGTQEPPGGGAWRPLKPRCWKGQTQECFGVKQNNVDLRKRPCDHSKAIRVKYNRLTRHMHVKIKSKVLGCLHSGHGKIEVRDCSASEDNQQWVGIPAESSNSDWLLYNVERSKVLAAKEKYCWDINEAKPSQVSLANDDLFNSPEECRFYGLGKSFFD